MQEQHGICFMQYLYYCRSVSDPQVLGCTCCEEKGGAGLRAFYMECFPEEPVAQTLIEA